MASSRCSFVNVHISASSSRAAVCTRRLRMQAGAVQRSPGGTLDWDGGDPEHAEEYPNCKPLRAKRGERKHCYWLRTDNQCQVRYVFAQQLASLGLPV